MDRDEALAKLAELDRRAKRLERPPTWVLPAFILLAAWVAWSLFHRV